MIRTAGRFAFAYNGDSVLLHEDSPSEGYCTLSYEPNDDAKSEVEGGALVLPQELLVELCKLLTLSPSLT